MLRCRLIIIAVLSVAGAIVSGCADTSRSKAQPMPIPGAIAATAPAGPARICIRVATAADLEAMVFTRPSPADHFPLCTVKIYNKASEPLIVGYTPNCVVVHCGPFEQPGPAVSFVHRREILGPQMPLELEIPPGNWAMSDGQLMVPTTLPAGPHETWATFKVEGDTPTQITSKRTSFIAP